MGKRQPLYFIVKKQSVPVETQELYVGELSEEETEEALLNPDNRIIKQITLNDVKETSRLFEALMGRKVTPRKDFIQEHMKEALNL